MHMVTDSRLHQAPAGNCLLMRVCPLSFTLFCCSDGSQQHWNLVENFEGGEILRSRFISYREREREMEKKGDGTTLKKATVIQLKTRKLMGACNLSILLITFSKIQIP